MDARTVIKLNEFTRTFDHKLNNFPHVTESGLLGRNAHANTCSAVALETNIAYLVWLKFHNEAKLTFWILY